MNLHIMYDEKVVSRTIDLFETSLPGENRFIVLKSSKKMQYVLKQASNIYEVQYGTEDFWTAVGTVSSYSYIIIHYMLGCSLKFVNAISHPRIIWIIWGADLYKNLLSFKGYHLYYDKSLINRIINDGKPFYKIIESTIRKRIEYNKAKKAINRIAFCGGLKGDYLLLKHYFPKINARHKDFYYYPIDNMVDVHLSCSLGDNIVVGHCASFYDNHEEVFANLAKLELKGRKVIAPLGYGNEKIREFVVKKGRLLLNELFVPIEGFLPLDEYNRLLSSARTFIYGNYRQEAVGNILVALYIGGAVFLHPSNVLFRTFQEMGIILYSTEELSEKIHYELTEVEKKNNREIVWRNYNYEHLLELIKEGFGSNGIS